MKKKIKKFRIVILAIVILIFILVGLLIFSSGIIRKLNREEVKFEIVDECGIIMNNLFHSINNEDGCRVKCYEECILKELKYIKSIFSHIENSCNKCFCFCK
jgi:hypothetical protein